MSSNLSLKTLFTLVTFATLSLAQNEIDESAMFADSSSTVDSASVVNTAAAAEGFSEKKTVGFSGSVNYYATPSVSRTWFDDPVVTGVGFSSRMVGDGYVDIRLLEGVKAFANLECAYVGTPSADLAVSTNLLKPDSGTVFSMPEFFLDANYNDLVYLRVGKQVLQWGRCYFWNPTDFVNVEKKTFVARMGNREGSYGIKMHIPYKTKFNLYSFIDAYNAQKMTDLAGAIRAEFLFGRTEIALSTWGKKGTTPIIGTDISTRLFGLQIAAEASLRNGLDMKTLDTLTFTPTDMGDTWIPRAAVTVTKMMPLSGVKDRITMVGEFYYNHAGYDKNMFADANVQRGFSLLQNPPKEMSDSLKQQIGQNFSTLFSLYEQNSYSRYYAALFTSVSRFIIEQMTLSCNAIGNLNQKSFVVSTGVTYQTLHDFNVGVSFDAAVGKKQTEYTFFNSGLTMRMQAGLLF